MQQPRKCLLRSSRFVGDGLVAGGDAAGDRGAAQATRHSCQTLTSAGGGEGTSTSECDESARSGGEPDRVSIVDDVVLDIASDSTKTSEAPSSTATANASSPSSTSANSPRHHVRGAGGKTQEHRVPDASGGGVLALRLRRELASFNPFDGDEGKHIEGDERGASDGDLEGRVRRGELFSPSASNQKIGDEIGSRMRAEAEEGEEKEDGEGPDASSPPMGASQSGEEQPASSTPSGVIGVSHSISGGGRGGDGSGGGGLSGGGGVGGGGGGLRRKGSSLQLWRSSSMLDLIDETQEAPDDVTPLATPDVSKHGSNEAWLFISQQQQHQRRQLQYQQPEASNPAGLGGAAGHVVRDGDGNDDGRTDDTSSVGSDSQLSGVAGASAGGRGRGGSQRGGDGGGGGMRRSASVVSFNAEVEVHDIGRLEDLAREKKVGPPARSASAAVKEEFLAFMVSLGLRADTAACREVRGSLKLARAHMLDNLDVTTAANDNRRPWETREASLRGGVAFFGGDDGGGGVSGVGSGDLVHSASCPSLTQFGLEKFVRDDDDGDGAGDGNGDPLHGQG